MYPCITIAAASTSAAANDGFKKTSHQRGSKTLSETNAIRRGTSSSRSADNVSIVSRTCASSPRQPSQAAACPSASRRSFAASSPSAYAFQSYSSQFMIHLAQRFPQQVQSRVKPRFHGRNRATQDLRHLFELEPLVNFQQNRLALLVRQPPQSLLDRHRQLDRQQLRPAR